MVYLTRIFDKMNKMRIIWLKCIMANRKEPFKILEFYLWYPPGYIVKPVLRGHLRNKEKVALTYKTEGSSIHNKFFYDRTRKGDL